MGELKSFEDFDLDVYNVDKLEEAFRTLYEIEYKYNMLFNKPFKGLEKRKYNILKILESAADSIIEKLAQTFEDVFADWLKRHAILEPEKWAEQRVEEWTDMGEDNDIIWGYLIDEYLRYKLGGSYRKDRKAISAIMDETREKINKMPFLKQRLSEYSYDEKENMYNDLEYEGYEEFGERWNKEFESEDEAREFIDDFEPDPENSIVFEDWDSFENLVIGSDRVLVELYEHLVFPLWYGKWKAEGIDTTRELVEEAYKMTQSINSMPTKKKFGVINHIINVNHQNGPMMEYYQDRFGISKNFLDLLSAEPEEGHEEYFLGDWNDELREIGVDI